jgi:hypothetical protein
VLLFFSGHKLARPESAAAVGSKLRPVRLGSRLHHDCRQRSYK